MEELEIEKSINSQDGELRRQLAVSKWLKTQDEIAANISGSLENRPELSGLDTELEGSIQRHHDKRKSIGDICERRPKSRRDAGILFERSGRLNSVSEEKLRGIFVAGFREYHISLILAEIRWFLHCVHFRWKR